MLVADTLQNAAAGIEITATPDGLSAINRPDCAATIWQRPMDTAFQTWFDRLDPEHLPRARVILRPEKVQKALEQILDATALPASTERSFWIKDATFLAETFAQVMQAPFIRLRLDAITTNACRKFHIDALTARLICTYRGTGTQYGISPDGEDPRHIFTVPTGSPIVLRGTRWPETPKSGLLHRSPPIEGTGETRSVLVLDPVFDLEDEI